MTPLELRAFVQLLDVTFRGDLTEPAELAIVRVFGRVPWPLAERAVDRLVRDGVVLLPVPGELVGALGRVVPDKTFGLSAALRGQTVAEYVAGVQVERAAERQRLGRGDGFDVLAEARAELGAGS